nr:MAG TPA: hypothetical protein [Caudoviricetes sp.]
MKTARFRAKGAGRKRFANHWKTPPNLTPKAL